MTKKISSCLLSALFLMSGLVSVPVAAQVSHPVCEYASSDPDGDGYGWENSLPCLVTEASSTETPAAMCVDDDGDGYGWDGSQVCRVDVMCHDSAPIGDGWGWDGENSCEIAAYPAPFSELAALKDFSKPEILFTQEIPAATLNCRQGWLLIFYADGQVRRVEGANTTRGNWSTGFEDSDGFVHLSGIGGSWIVLTPNSVSYRTRGQDPVNDCFWE